MKHGNSKVSNYFPRFRVIPFTSLGKQNGMLLGMKIDIAKIYFEEEEKCIKDAIIGIYDEHLSKRENYTALVGLDMLERRIDNEYTADTKI